MYFTVILCVFVQLLSINSISAEIRHEVSSQGSNITIDEFTILLLSVKHIEKAAVKSSCSGLCKVHNVNVTTSCYVIDENGPKALKVKTTQNMTRDLEGGWLCTFKYIIRVRKNANDTAVESLKQTRVRFRLNFPAESKSINDIKDWVYIAGAVGVLVIIIIIGQTICIVHFKAKARAVRRATLLTRRSESPEHAVRYSKMPVAKKNVEICQEARESGIYEALETVRNQPVPKPPPLTTLPRPPKESNPSDQSTPPEAKELPHSTDDKSLLRSLTNGVPLPSPGKKNKKQENNLVMNKFRASIERIKKRPRIPTPDEIYEEMAPPSPELERRFKTQPKPMLPHKAAPATSHTLNIPLKVSPNELKQAKGKQKQVTVPPEVPTSVASQPVLPFAPAPRPVFPPAPAGKPVLPPAPAGKPVLPPAPAGKPVLPPAAALKPVAVTSPIPSRPQKTPIPIHTEFPKLKPPPPTKPKQLHPLPPRPRPESIPVQTEHGEDSSSDEDWTYEPLPNYNIYNM